ncbi:flagellar motor switch protein FliM [Alphaproteobacteria bacterium]|jgi:flagellar motor switch protein FliM|nr:flagellar motor switch protein FliM [Alphaproteobacteria bacterium]MDA8611030.1 flagellar motor switch protein FliM [Alphaproteobacteria bacterium]
MSSRKLSSEEVDALMDGLKSSTHDVNADVSGSSDVRAFQFGQDDLSLMGDYYALRLINERFARVARGVFLPMLRVQPRISPFPPEVKTFDEYCDSIDGFMNLNISRMEELRGPMLMTLRPKFISTLTASYYGGSIVQPDQKRNEFTSTEERVIEIIHTGLSNSLAEAWSDLMPITLAAPSREVNPQFASFVDGSELVIICSFLIQLPNAEAVNLEVVYPLQTLKPIASQLRSRVQSDSGDDDVTWREKMERAILNIPLNITALLGEPVMSMGQLIRLKTGDVVPIQINEGIEVRVEDNPIFLAEIGEVSGQVAVSLSRRI